MNQTSHTILWTRVSKYSIATSLFGLILLEFQIYNLDWILDNIPIYFIFFFGSLIFYLIVYPWTLKKEILLNDNSITIYERVGFGLKKKEQTILKSDMTDVSVVKNGVRILTDSGETLLRGSSFEMVGVKTGNNLVKSKKTVPKHQLFKMISIQS